MKGAATATNAHARETIKNHKFSMKTDLNQLIQNTKIMKILGIQRKLMDENKKKLKTMKTYVRINLFLRMKGETIFERKRSEN